jgi:hypothetical protein
MANLTKWPFNMADLTRPWAFDGPYLKIDLFDLVKMVTLVKITNQKIHVSFMPHAFSQNKHPFDQCGHFNQVEPFEKPRFVVVTIAI